MKQRSTHAPVTSRLLLLLLFCMAAGSVTAQTWQWAKGAGDIGTDAASAITTDPYGNTYITGNIAGRAKFSGTMYQGNGLYEIFIAKYDATGNLLWVKLAGSDRNDQGRSIKWKNGSLYVCGIFEDTALFENTTLISRGESDAFVARYNDNGNLQWVKQAGGTQLDLAMAIDVDDNENVYVAGQYERAITIGSSTLTTSNIYSESFYARYDKNGNLQWAKTTTGNNTNLITGLAFDNHHSILLTGFFGSTLAVGNKSIDATSASYDIFITKVDIDNGNTDWLKRAGSTYEDGAHGICADAYGNPVITGYFAGTAYFDNNSITYSDYNDVFVARYDSAGNNLWARAGKGNKLDTGFGITTDENNNIYATGMFQNIIDFDGIQLTSPDVLDRDIFVVSYTPDGTLRWLAEAGGEDTDCGMGIAIAPNNRITIAGYYLHTCSFGNIPIDYADGADVFVASLTQPLTGIPALADSQINIYPNPATTNTVITLTGNTDGNYVVTNTNGQAVTTGRISGSNTTINTNALANGVYIVTVTTNNGSYTGRLIKM